MEPKQQPPYPLRMSAQLREALERSAEAGKRSLNAEVVMRLELSLSRDPEKVPELRARSRALSRQLFDLEVQLMAIEEICITRDARLKAQISKDPSANQLAPLQEALKQAERVAHGLKAAMNDVLARYQRTIEQLPRSDVEGYHLVFQGHHAT